MKKINIAYFGGRILGYSGLDILNKYRDRLNVSIVIANKKDGVEGSDWNPPVLKRAKALGFPCLAPETLKSPEVIQAIQEKNIDVLLNAFCSRIIPSEILELPTLGAINFHYGKLPKYKGRFIVSHIINNGEKMTCATVHYMDREIDNGDIIYEKPVKVLNDDTAKTLYMRCTKASLYLFEKVLKNLISGKPLPKKKQSGQGNYYPFDELNGCQVDLAWNTDKIARFIRAVTFLPISRPWIKIGSREYDIILREKK